MRILVCAFILIIVLAPLVLTHFSEPIGPAASPQIAFAYPGSFLWNSSPEETVTPLTILLATTPVAGSEIPGSLFPTPTTFPRNPAALDSGDVYTSVLFGGIASIILFCLIAGILRLRWKQK
jgi:hypothetical protein